jgi:hypothetical protein
MFLISIKSSGEEVKYMARNRGRKGGRSGNDRRGLASADEATRKRVASMGGKARGEQRRREIE